MSDNLLVNNVHDSNQSNMPHHGNNEIQETPIQTFYAGQTIFITGGTGFLGKILIEKLLRCCPNVSKIYIMIRSKRNKSIMNRLDQILENSLYDRVREATPNFCDKIVPIEQIGEFTEVSLGITQDDTDLLIREVSIVFHLLANVNFNEDIKSATVTNVYPTCALLDLIKRMPNLKSFIHVSTITSNYFAKHIDESFYEYPITSEEFIALMRPSSKNIIDEKILRVASQWPNSYTFTKAMAEILVKDRADNLPIGIFRPSIVTNVAREPLVGWIDNYYGVLGVLAPYFLGLLRFFNGRPDYFLNIIPVDITINALIAAAWDVFNQSHRRGDKMLIYNSVSSNDAPLTIYNYSIDVEVNVRKYPTKFCLWMPTLTWVRNNFIFAICMYLSYFPALLIGIVQKCRGARNSFRIWKLDRVIHEYCKTVSYFVSNKKTHADDNIHELWQSMSNNDQALFYFNMKGFDWSKYVEDHVKGTRIYLLKDDFSSLEASRIKWKRLYWIHQATKIMFILIVSILVWKVFASILS